MAIVKTAIKMAYTKTQILVLVLRLGFIAIYPEMAIIENMLNRYIPTFQPFIVV